MSEFFVINDNGINGINALVSLMTWRETIDDGRRPLLFIRGINSINGGTPLMVINGIWD